MRATGWQTLLTTGLLLAGALLVAALVIAAVSRWRRRGDKEQLTPGDQLTHFRSLYERGDMSAEEFQRLRALLSGQVVGRPPAAVPQKPKEGEQPPAADGPAPPDGVVNLGGEWYFEEYARGAGVSSVGLDEKAPTAPTEEERNSILDLFRRKP